MYYECTKILFLDLPSSVTPKEIQNSRKQDRQGLIEASKMILCKFLLDRTNSVKHYSDLRL